MGFATFLFRKGADGRVEARVFDSDDLPGHPWVDSPGKCGALSSADIVYITEVEREEKPKPEVHHHKKAHKLETREELIAELERRCIEIDRRWGITKLRQILGLD